MQEARKVVHAADNAATLTPEQKQLIRERLLADGFAEPADFLEPEPATHDDLLLVHERGWLARLRDGALTHSELAMLEIPYSKRMVDAFVLAAGGSILAARCALRDGEGCNIGGGFHHAYPGHGEGFCAIHDVAVAIRRMQQDGMIERAMVVDTDVHHGNGTAAIFGGDETVFTVSLHQENNYPSPKPPSNIDVHLADGVGDNLLELIDAPPGCDGPAIRLNLDYREPLIFHPYYEAGGRKDGAWRLTWMHVTPDTATGPSTC